nr:hypothetical protein OH820_20175 [Streptomyces sp. NBC_00857]
MSYVEHVQNFYGLPVLTVPPYTPATLLPDAASVAWRLEAGPYSTDERWGGEVPGHYVLEAAGTLLCSPHAVAKRMVALGLRLPYVPEPDDDRILKHREGGGRHGPLLARPGTPKRPSGTCSPSRGTRAAARRTSSPG